MDAIAAATAKALKIESSRVKLEYRYTTLYLISSSIFPRPICPSSLPPTPPS
jgi:hypothetical protein